MMLMMPPAAPLQSDGAGGGDLPIPPAGMAAVPAVLQLPANHAFISAAQEPVDN
eukprot:SAG11_NODE_17856_length_507_cov_0.892157_1_plen_53_part_10